MNRPLTVVFSALEALLVVGIGLGLTLVPLTIMWAFQYGLQIDWIVFWRAASDIWLLGHGVDMRVTLDSITAASVGFPDAASPFILTIAPLGFALLTVLLGQRAGRRIAETPHFGLGLLVALATFGLLALGVVLSTLHVLARPSIWQGALFPTLIFAFGLGVGASLARVRLTAPAAASQRLIAPAAARPQAPHPVLDAVVSRVRDTISDVPRSVVSVARSAAWGGTAAAALVVSIAAVVVAVLLVTSYAEVIALYEGAHAGVLGGVALTVAQLAFVPNLVAWATSWFVGPGFAIGAGSAVSPLGTSLGPIPGIPFLGALPTGELSWGFLGLLVPVLAGFVVGVVLRFRMNAEEGGLQRLIVTGVSVGVAAGILLGLLAWFSAGAAGPGRLIEVGPAPWVVGFFAFLEVGAAAIAGILSARRRQ